MAVATVPSVLAEPLGSVEGIEIVPWDLADEPARREEIEVVIAPPVRSPWIKRLGELPALKGLLLSSAGYEHALRWLPDGVELANAVGVHDTATAEMALTLCLAAQREIPSFVRHQDRHEWQQETEQRSLADARVLIIGYGGIGRALARRLQACEAEVTAVASRPRGGDAQVDTVHGVGELPSLLPEHDIVVLAVPDTPATRHLLDAAALAAIPDGGLVVNVGRGPAIDTDALVAQCSSGRLRAALDVTDPEPLPEDHPLWSAPGVLISPHTGGNSRTFVPRAAAYARRQLEHYRDHGHLDHVVAVGGEDTRR